MDECTGEVIFVLPPPAFGELNSSLTYKMISFFLPSLATILTLSESILNWPTELNLTC